MIINRSRRHRVIAATATGALIAVGVAACGSGTSSASGGSSAAAATTTSSPAAPAATSAPTAPNSTNGNAATAASHSAQIDFTSYTSASSFAGTVSALKKSAASNGMMVLGDLNQAGALKSAGLSLKGAHAFFVGSPTKGKMFFTKDAAIGSVVPLRMYVWVNAAGKTQVGYFDPAGLFKAVNPAMAAAGQQMSKAAAMIAKGATQ